MKHNGPYPQPELRRNFRASISLPNDVAELFGMEYDKSRVAEMALRLWYAQSDIARDARLTAVLFNTRTTV